GHTTACTDFFFFSSRRRHTKWPRDWSSDVCSSDLVDRTADRDARYQGSRSASRSAVRSTRAEPKRQMAADRPPSATPVHRYPGRSEERRVGKERRFWWSVDRSKKKKRQNGMRKRSR